MRLLLALDDVSRIISSTGVIGAFEFAGPGLFWGFCGSRLWDRLPAMGEHTCRGLSTGTGRESVTTRWSVVLAAGSTDSSRAADALEQPCRSGFWLPRQHFLS
jgi:hypothetical protein